MLGITKDTFKDRYSLNVLLFYVITFFTWSSFWIPIYVIFYKSIGLNFTQILLMTSVRNIVSIVLVIPTGVLADMFGRKKCLLIAAFFQVVGFIILYFSSTFEMVLLANLVIGVFFAFMSGADIAFLFDTLKVLKKEKSFKMTQSLVSGVTVLALAFASLVGGFVASAFSLRAPILLNIVAYALAFILIIFLKEPPRDYENENLKFFLHLKESVGIFIKNKSLFFISIYYASFMMAGEVVQNFSQGYFQHAGLDIKYFGVFNFIFLAAAATSTLLILKFSRERRNPFLEINIGFIGNIIMFTVLSIFLNPLVGALFICVGNVAKGTSTIFIRDFSNKQIDSKMRATIFSLQGFVLSLMQVFLIPLFGIVADNKGIQMGFLSIGGFILIIGLVCLPLAQVYRKNA